MMRLSMPKGGGLFAVIVDLHAGAWNTGGLSDSQVHSEVLVK
jgi:hypothetical protein